MNFPCIQEVYPYAIGYIISLFLAHLLIRLTIDPLWKAHGDPLKEEWRLSSLNQGYVERLLYTLSWQFGVPAFIGVWLALKVASQWRKWSEEAGYNIFLIGSGLSVLYGILGAKEIFWIQHSSWQSIGVPVIVVIVNLLLIWFNHRKCKKIKSAKNMLHK